MNIFLRELRANRKSLIIWCACMFLLILSGMGKYTAYSSGDQSATIFNEMPHSIKALLGMGSFDVTTMAGYFAMLFLYVELSVAIHAALLGAGIIAKEERDKTTEFLMIKPVSRKVIITSKLLAAFINVLILNIVTSISSIVMVHAYDKGNSITNEVVQFMFSMFIVQLIFMTLGATLAAILKRPKTSGSVTMCLLLIAFIISKITDLTDKLNLLNILSPFKYFSYADIVNGKGLEAAAVMLSILLIVFLAGLTYIFYPKRDLQI